MSASLRGVAKSFPAGPVLRGVDLELPDGEIVGLAGRNGAGKSTLAKIVAGIYSQDAGDIQISPGGVGLSLVEPQTLNPRLNGLDNLRYSGALHGLEEAAVDQAVEELSAWFPLGDALGSRVERCSTGAKHKLCLLRALLPKPRLLLLDEPTQGLDAISSAQLARYLLHRCKERGDSVLYITHHLEELESLADRIAILDGGRVAACGKRSEIAGMFSLPRVLEIRHHATEAAPFLAACSALGEASVLQPNQLRVLLPGQSSDLAELLTAIPAPPRGVWAMEIDDAPLEELVVHATRRAPAEAAAPIPPTTQRPPAPRPPWRLLLLAASRRNLRVARSYKLAQAMALARLALLACALLLVAGMLKRGGGDFVAIGLVGLMALGAQAAGLGILSPTIAGMRTMKLLEHFCATPSGLGRVLATEAALGAAMATLRFLALCAALALLVRPAPVVFLFLCVGFACSLLAHAALGVLRGSLSLRFHRGDPIGFVMTWAATLLSGAFIPLHSLPHALQAAAALLPTTYVVMIMRGGLDNNAAAAAPLAAVAFPAAALALAGAMLVMRRTIASLQKNGTVSSQ